jgi:hypothetical protein
MAIFPRLPMITNRFKGMSTNKNLLHGQTRTSNPNLVNKVVFPLEILPIAYAAPAILQLATGCGVPLFLSC